MLLLPYNFILYYVFLYDYYVSPLLLRRNYCQHSSHAVAVRGKCITTVRCHMTHFLCCLLTLNTRYTDMGRHGVSVTHITHRMKVDSIWWYPKFASEQSNIRHFRKLRTNSSRLNVFFLSLLCINLVFIHIRLENITCRYALSDNHCCFHERLFNKLVSSIGYLVMLFLKKTSKSAGNRSIN